MKKGLYVHSVSFENGITVVDMTDTSSAPGSWSWCSERSDGNNGDDKKRKLVTERCLLAALGSPEGREELTEEAFEVPSPKIPRDGYSQDNDWEEGSSHALSEPTPHEVRSDIRREGVKETVFFNFEEQRKSLLFSKGEVWAMYDEYGLPRRYAQVCYDGCGHLTDIRFLVHKEWDKCRRYNDYRTLRAHGVFVLEYWISSFDSTAFSHKVERGVMRNSNFYIYPRKGDIWAIVKSIDDDAIFQAGSPTTQQYQIVEVLDDFDSETCVRVVYMVKVTGYQSVFRRHEEFACILPSESNRFSHQVPYVVVTGDCALIGCLELDPSSLPLYTDNFENDVGPEIDDRYLCLGLLDTKIITRKIEYRDGSVWAVYDHSNGLPLKYIVLDCFTSHPEFGEKMIALEFHPISDDEKRWYNAGLPITCGYFETKNCVEEKLSLSHPVFSRRRFFEVVGKSCYYIFPKQRDVWGIYKDIDTAIGRNLIGKQDLEYEIVEIAGGFGSKRNIKGIKARYLVRVEGFKSLFRRNTGCQNLRIPWSEVYRFSHHIPSYRFPKGNALRNFFVLDPLLVPAKGDVFKFSDPPFLKVSKAHPLSLANKYFTRNRSSLEDSEMDTESSDGEDQGESIVQEQGYGSNGDAQTQQNPKLKFYYFDSGDVTKDFECGQIWALHDDFDGIPRSYAYINRLAPQGKVDVSLLEFYPIDDEEMKWAEESLPLACGLFRISKLTVSKELSLFSHRVVSEEWEGVKSFHKILPKKSEVWAIYKNWDAARTSSSSDLRNNYEYKLVEIVSDFSEGSELTVAALTRVEGWEATFERHLHEGFKLFHKFSRQDFPRFSHRIPCVKGMGDGSNKTFKELWKVKFSHIGL